jgi:hypothetical protein
VLTGCRASASLAPSRPDSESPPEVPLAVSTAGLGVARRRAFVRRMLAVPRTNREAFWRRLIVAHVPWVPVDVNCLHWHVTRLLVANESLYNLKL